MTYTNYLGKNVYSSLVGYDQETDILLTFSYDGDNHAEVLSYRVVNTYTKQLIEPDDFNRIQIAKGLQFLMQRIEDRGERFIDKNMWTKCYVLV